MNKQIIVGGLVAVLIVGGLVTYSLRQKNDQVASEQQNSEQERMEQEKMANLDQEKMMQGDAANTDTVMQDDKMIADGEKSAENEAMMSKSGSYQDYSPETVTSEQAKGNKVVIFFHASWCPSCKAANIAFQANPDKIPAGITVLKADYDSSTELKKKYGVTYQHTFVQIDNSGNAVTKWNSGDIDFLKQNIK